MSDDGSTARRCSAPYRVRFDEAGPDGLLRTSVLLRYAQDLAWFHSAARGFDRAWYAERGLAWLARAAEVAVLAPDRRVGDDARRDDAGRRRATGLGAPPDRLRRRGRRPCRVDPCRLGPPRCARRPDSVPAEFDEVFGAPEGDVPARPRRRSASRPPTPAPATFAVRPQELDPMDHVNNAVYADWLDEAVIAAGDPAAVRAVPRLARLEYARSAEPDASLSGEVWPADGGWAYRLSEAAGPELLRAHLAPAITDQTDEAPTAPDRPEVPGPGRTCVRAPASRSTVVHPRTGPSVTNASWRSQYRVRTLRTSVVLRSMRGRRSREGAHLPMPAPRTPRIQARLAGPSGLAAALVLGRSRSRLRLRPSGGRLRSRGPGGHRAAAASST